MGNIVSKILIIPTYHECIEKKNDREKFMEFTVS
jgi:hypothetical protein